MAEIAASWPATTPRNDDFFLRRYARDDINFY